MTFIIQKTIKRVTPSLHIKRIGVSSKEFECLHCCLEHYCILLKQFGAACNKDYLWKEK